MKEINISPVVTEEDPIEEAKAYANIMEEFSVTQEELAKLISSERSVIANTIRLLNLPPDVQDMISEGLISAGPRGN